MSHGLPLIPGNSFSDPAKNRYHVSQSLKYNNGYRVPDAQPRTAIGGDAIYPNQLTESELDELANFHPTLTYGKSKPEPPKAFVPAHVAFDKKVLRFYGYFKETVNESPDEHYRVRHIVLYYWLEDDSISIVEPPKANSGIPQGKLIRRQRLPKNDVGDHYNWREINLGTNLCVYGRVFRITDCDNFTKNFLESEGIEIGEKESIPQDPYLLQRKAKAEVKTFKTPSSYDDRKQFLEMDKKVLRFYAVWDDRDKMFGEARNFLIHFYLVDDTLEVREQHEPNDGRDPFPVLIRRGKIAKDRYDVNPTFPSVVMELSSNEVKAFFSPRDFKLGETVNINGRNFLLYDCDNFTKAWYYQHFGITDFTPVNLKSQSSANAQRDRQVGPYTGFGTLEDSMASAITVQPNPPKLDYVKQVDSGPLTLRYELVLDSLRGEDRNRRFILSYHLANDNCNIFEPPIRNSGVPGGTFLSRARIPKPEHSSERPAYYGPMDFKIGAKIEVFGNRFKVTNCDKYVLKFLEAHSEQIPSDVIESIRQRLSEHDAVRSHGGGKGASMKLRRQEGDILRMMQEVKSQLKKMAITDKARIDNMFLRYNFDRNGFITVKNLQEMCKEMQLPDDEDICSALLDEYGTDGKMDLEQFRKFFEG